MIPPPAASGTPLILFGGTFDPVHRAHISAARAVSKALQQAPVYLLPNAVPPHRPQPLADAGHRLAMLKLAIAAWYDVRAGMDLAPLPLQPYELPTTFFSDLLAKWTVQLV